MATSYDRQKMSGHMLDWANQPNQFKTYPEGRKIALPQMTQPPYQTLWSLWRKKTEHISAVQLTVDKLAQLLVLGYTITAQSRAGQTYYRSAASAGALYPNEIYLSAFQVEGLDQGVYHFDLLQHGLTRIRKGNFASITAEASKLKTPDHLIASLFVSGIFFRSAWKYRDRAYRYVLLDGGHILANFLLAIKALGFDARWHFAFKDQSLETLLGIDPEREGVLAVIHLLGRENKNGAQTKIEPVEDEIAAASRTSGLEVSYAKINQMHELSKTVVHPKGPLTDMTHCLGHLPPVWQTFETDEPTEKTPSYPASLVNRRSRRNFVISPMGFGQLRRLITLVGHHWSQPREAPVNYVNSLAVGLWINSLDGLVPGFYLLDLTKNRIGLVQKGPDQGNISAFCLDQAWLKNSAIYFLFMTNLSELEKSFGPRGYRYALLAAGEMGQATYLGATGLGLGCCGIGALYDQEARLFLGLNNDSILIYLLAVGAVKGLPWP